MVRNSLFTHPGLCVFSATVSFWLRGKPTATLSFYIFWNAVCSEHMLGRRYPKVIQIISAWQTRDDQSSILANTKCCKGCRSAFGECAHLSLRPGVRGRVNVVTLILCLANIQGRKLSQCAKSFMLWNIWLSLSWIVALLLNSNTSINFCCMLSAGNVI